MPFALDFSCDVDDDGRLPKSRQRVIRDNLLARAGGEVRIRVTNPTRSTQANRFYWGAVVAPVSAFLSAAGTPKPGWALHEYHKGLFLPALAAELLEETGEVVDFAEEAEVGGVVHRRLSSRKLDSGTFSRFCEMVMGHWGAMGCDFPEVAMPTRGGQIHEPTAF